MEKIGEELFKKRYHESTKRIGVEEFRSYFVPFSLDDNFAFDYGIINRDKSSLFVSLNGKWKIKALLKD